jgi:SAM-dependent methyltransferase
MMNILKAARRAMRLPRETYGSFRARTRWRAVARDQPHIMTLRAIDDVGPCFERMKELARYEAKYRVAGAPEFYVRGYCASCGGERLLVTARDGEEAPAWRETATCRCGMNTRMRAVLDWLLHIENVPANARIYCTEATTGFFKALSRLWRGTVGSEFIPHSVPVGTVAPSGIRCEDLERLSFADESFDYIVSLDVLEHVFSYEAALQEMLRVLKPGGVAILTVPFNWDQSRTVRRAEIAGGTVRQLLPPIYHGDPVNKNGVLLVFDYGWDLLDHMRGLGWRDVGFVHFWSESRKYFGRNFLLRAVK